MYSMICLQLNTRLYLQYCTNCYYVENILKALKNLLCILWVINRATYNHKENEYGLGSK